MPFYSVTYILPNERTGDQARFLCNKCGSPSNWHHGATDQPDLPIVLRCDTCFNECAEFATEEEKNRGIAEIHERALFFNGQVRVERQN